MSGRLEMGLDHASCDHYQVAMDVKLQAEGSSMTNMHEGQHQWVGPPAYRLPPASRCPAYRSSTLYKIRIVHVWLARGGAQPRQRWS
jgi:hypothetical protein